jgi:hypothetical protein
MNKIFMERKMIESKAFDSLSKETSYPCLKGLYGLIVLFTRKDYGVVVRESVENFECQKIGDCDRFRESDFFLYNGYVMLKNKDLD